MPFYKSVKFTTVLALALLLTVVVVVSHLIEIDQNDTVVKKIAIQKTNELSHKIGQDIEVILRLSDSVHDLEDILINYLVADVNYIAAYDETAAPIHVSFFNVFVPNREDFISKYRDKVIKENNVKTFIDESLQVVQVLTRFQVPKTDTEIIAQRFGVVYFEYSLERDMILMNKNNQSHLNLNIIWSLTILVLVYFFLDFYFLRPIRKLSDATQKLADGELLVHPLEANNRMEDELFALFEKFNSMSKYIKQNSEI